MLEPANEKPNTLMDYQYECISDPDPYDETYLSSGRVQSISALKTHMLETNFSGYPTMLVFDSLERYWDGCNSVDLSEIEAHQCLGDFFHGATKEIYNLINVADRFTKSMVDWCTEVDSLLSKFSTYENIQNTV